MNRYDIALGKLPPKTKYKPPSVWLPKFEGPGVMQMDPVVARTIDMLATLPDELPPRRRGSIVTSGEISQTDRENILEQYMRTHEGRTRLGTAMAGSLTNQVNYQSMARRMFLFNDLAGAALPIFNDVAGEPAFSEDGEHIIILPRPRIVFSQEFDSQALVPVFGLSVSPEMTLNSIRQRRFDLIDRMQDLVIQTFREEEDSRAFMLLDRMIDLNNRNITTSERVLTPEILMNAFAVVEADDLRVANVYMNAQIYTMVRRWGREGRRDILDIVTNRNLLMQGLMATIWGAQIIVTRSVPENTIYVTAEPQYVGRIFQSNFSVISADDPMNRTLGWQFSEQIGMCTVNSHGAARLTFENPLTGGASAQPLSPHSRRTFLSSSVIGRR